MTSAQIFPDGSRGKYPLSGAIALLSTTSYYGGIAQAVAQIGTTPTTLHITLTETLTASLTVPSNIDLVGMQGFVVTVPNSITLTINGSFEAGWFQVFSLGSSGLVTGLRELCFEWFGAIGDAISPSIPILGKDLATFDPVVNIPTGTNDSAAIRTTMRCAINAEMMSNYLDPATWGSPNVGPGSQPFWPSTKLTGYTCILRGRPGAGYLVSGDNVLGPQGVMDGKFFFDGQGCSFEWLPANSTDSFIDKLDLIERPVLENFNLRTWGFTGNRGRFIHTANTKNFMNVLRGAKLSNINIDRGGYYNLTTDPFNVSVPGPTTGNALTRVIHLEGTNLCDTWDIDHFQCWGYNNFLTVVNKEAVAISVHNSDLGSYYDSAIHVYFPDGYSGGLWFDNCELGMLGTSQTFIQTQATAASLGEFRITSCRMETRADDFTLIDAEFGAFYIDGLNTDYGNPTGRANATSCKVYKWTKTVQFTNCWMPQNITVWCYTAADYATYSGNFAPIRFNRCNFPSGTPVIIWRRSDTNAVVADYPALFTAKLIMRDVQVLESPDSLNWSVGPNSGVPNKQTLRLQRFDTATGNMYANIAYALPIGIIITSIKVISELSNLAVTDRIRLTFTGSLFLDSLLNGANITKNELIPATQKGVCVVSTVTNFNVLTATYNLGGAAGTTPVPAIVEVEYRGIISATDLNLASLLATMV